MNRRLFVAGLVGGSLAAHAMPTLAQGVFKPYVLRIVREVGWEDLMQRELCVASTVYVVDPDRILSDVPGRLQCHAMELPRRGNQQEISAIPAGTYAAKARVSDKNGRVIELIDVRGRDLVQLHAGNHVDQTIGCLLLGTAPVSRQVLKGDSVIVAPSNRCWISGSRAARDALLADYGWSNANAAAPTRPIKVIIS